MFINIDVSQSDNADAKQLFINVDNYENEDKSGALSGYIYLKTDDETIEFYDGSKNNI